MKNIAVITGASAGMGKQFALQLEQNYSFDEMWLVARSREKLQAVADALKTPCKLICGDLTDRDFIASFPALLETEKPNVTVLVNGAGYGIMNKVEDTSYQDAVGMIDLNVRALFSLTYACLPYMAKGARIVNIGSFSSFEPLPYMSLYASSKAFVLSFTRSLNVELKERGVHALCLCPMWVKTDFFARANQKGLVNHYPHPYEAEWVVAKAIKAMDSQKDYVVPGLYAKMNLLGVKLLPHSLVMKTFLKQQELDRKN